MHQQYSIYWINLFLKKKINVVTYTASFACSLPRMQRRFPKYHSTLPLRTVRKDVTFSKKLSEAFFKNWACHFWFPANIYLFNANNRSTRYQNDFINITLVSLLLTLNIFHTFSSLFCWLWAGKSLLSYIIILHSTK